MQKENLHDAPDLFDKRDSAAKTCFQLSRCTLLSLVFPKFMFKYCENASNMAKCQKYCASNCLVSETVKKSQSDSYSARNGMTGRLFSAVKTSFKLKPQYRVSDKKGKIGQFHTS